MTLDVRELTVDLGRGRGVFRAVDGVSFDVANGETVGLVGESGAGKSTIGRAIVGLTRVTGGSISFAGQDITHATRGQRRRLSSVLQMVFQDPYSSLNPARTVGDTLAEPLLAKRIGARRRVELVAVALQRVGLPAGAARRYPAEFSGGQRQRIAVARALVGAPRLVVCDEPVSGMDVSVQAQIVNLLADLQTELGLSYLFIAHDLAVVRHLSRRIVVLFRGQVMESGATGTVCAHPAHPYTRALLAAVPPPEPGLARAAAAARRDSATGSGYPPLPADAGCRFVARCRYAVAACARQRPALVQARTGSLVACLRHQEIPDHIG